jgi:small subunit ribosomal protein S20
MAHHKSAKKRIRQTETRRLENRYYMVTTRNAIKKLRKMTNKDEALQLYPKVVSMLDKLAKRNQIHKNQASNLKSKLIKFVNKIGTVETQNA